MEPSSSPRLRWDFGTAYDLFTSLHVLHHPEKFGLRLSWAAGVRSRLTASERKTLETAQALFSVPAPWLHSLPGPKDAPTALEALRQMEPVKRLPALALKPHDTPELADLFQRVLAQGDWTEGHVEELRQATRQRGGELPRAKTLTVILENWAHPEAFGESYLSALQSYYNSFFAEEETLLRPNLEQALERAQEAAARLSQAELLEQLSQGVRFNPAAPLQELVLVPSYWITPFIFLDRIDPACMLMLFGARPADASLVPGEVVPTALLQALKALSDPTRLRILRYLAAEPLTPSALARRLRLRAPTVTHHLNALRLAGLVRLNLPENGERTYSARQEAIETAFAALEAFIQPGERKDFDLL